MDLDWTTLVSDSPGIAGYALLLVFWIAGHALASKKRQSVAWLVPGAYLLALLCIVGAFFLAYQDKRAANATRRTNVGPSADAGLHPPSMSTGVINQRVERGSAVAGVQGSVTIVDTADDERAAVRADQDPPR